MPYNLIKDTPKRTAELMKAGEIIAASTNAELLNALLGKKYKQWYKCSYDLKDADTFIWMVSLDNLDNNGHRNRFENDTTIVEQFDKSTTTKNVRFYHGLSVKQRLVFEKIETNNGRIYKFHGLYKLSDRKDDDYIRVLELENKEYNFR